MNPKCVCGSDTHWEADYDTEDFGLERPGIVGLYRCPNCKALIEVTQYIDGDDDVEN